MSAKDQHPESASSAIVASERLLTLYELLRNRRFGRIASEFGCSPADLAIFEGHYSVPLPMELQNFLVRTLPYGSLDIGVYKTKPPAGLLEEQLNTVPFYPNLENHLFGLGWWTGQGDGDGWLYDLVEGGIYAVGLGDSYDHTRETLLASSYLKFAGFEPWVGFLHQECRRRNWLD